MKERGLRRGGERGREGMGGRERGIGREGKREGEREYFLPSVTKKLGH